MMKSVSTMVLGATLMLLGAAAARAEPAEEIGKRVLEQYGRVHVALAGDSIEGAREAAAQIADTVKPCDCTLEEGVATEELVDVARGMPGADLATLREQLKPLSRARAAHLDTTNVAGTQLYSRPMVKACWLQPREGSTTHNPCLGKAMAGCGVKVERVAS